MPSKQMRQAELPDNASTIAQFGRIDHLDKNRFEHAAAVKIASRKPRFWLSQLGTDSGS